MKKKRLEGQLKEKDRKVYQRKRHKERKEKDTDTDKWKEKEKRTSQDKENIETWTRKKDKNER